MNEEHGPLSGPQWLLSVVSLTHCRYSHCLSRYTDAFIYAQVHSASVTTRVVKLHDLDRPRVRLFEPPPPQFPLKLRIMIPCKYFIDASFSPATVRGLMHRVVDWGSSYLETCSVQRFWLLPLRLFYFACYHKI